jgi:hypothetical protein
VSKPVKKTVSKKTHTIDTITKDNISSVPLPSDGQEKIEKIANKVPYAEIVSLFNEILPELPEVRFLSEPRKKALKSRWLTHEKTQSLDWWRVYFEDIKQSDFLMGRRKNSNWQCDFDWILKQTNFVKIREGNYVNR